MSEAKWELDCDGTQVNLVSQTNIPWLDIHLETWFEIEEDQKWWTAKQKKVYDDFFHLKDSSKESLSEMLESTYELALERGQIYPSSFKKVLDSIYWKKSHICVPLLCDAQNAYILLLLETNWKLSDDLDHNLELEVLYTNGKIELIQEMSGLWNRIEWFYDYLKRPKTVE